MAGQSPAQQNAMSPDLVTILAQFGPAGLMGLLWIMERRHAALRERQLSESHSRIAQQEDAGRILLEVVRDNTRAITSLEHTQQHLLKLARRLDERLTGGRRSTPSARSLAPDHAQGDHDDRSAHAA
jgi:hypothetical protein